MTHSLRHRMIVFVHVSVDPYMQKLRRKPGFVSSRVSSGKCGLAMNAKSLVRTKCAQVVSRVSKHDMKFFHS